MPDLRTVVIVCDHGFMNGGQAKVAIETALALRAGGLSVIFFCGAGPVDQRLRDAGVTSICLDQQDLLANPDRAEAALRGVWNWPAARRLNELLRTLDPDHSVVHVHGWAKSLSPSIGPVVTRSAIPHVYTLHEFFLACPNGGFYDYQRREICTRRPLGIACLSTHCDPRSRVHKAWRVVRHAVLQSAGRMPGGLRDVIYLTDTQLRAVQPYLPPGIRLHRLPNAVPPTAAERVRAEDNRLLLFVGRLSPEKGGELVARAARQVGLDIAFAGEGEARQAIQAANPCARMLGWLNPEELSQWLGRARCLVFPSLWYEGYPMSVIEAMQNGLPVLTSDLSAAAEVVRHDIDGLHVATGSEQAWVEALRLVQEDERVGRYSRRAR